MIELLLKTCNTCKEDRPRHLFAKRKTAPDGLQYKCKSCQKHYDQRTKPIYDRNNAEKRAAYHKSYRIKNKDRLDQMYRTWRDNNKEQQREYYRRYVQKRSNIDPIFKLKRLLRSRLRNLLKHQHNVGLAVEELGCTGAELVVYLEGLFTPGMSWDNHGKWHVDHIKPLASFDLADIDQVKAACHYTNLQPLWAYDNLKKGSKL
jgi:hypothetical protein